MQCRLRTIQEKGRYNSIDLAKFVSSILVVMIHIPPFGLYDNDTIISLNYLVQNCLARIAVPFFFVCSGFFLYKKTTLHSFNIEPTKKYIFHMLKLYIIWSLVYFPISLRTFFLDEKGMLHAILIYLRNFIFVGSYTHLWYLPATIFAVGLVSFLLYKRVSPYFLVGIASVMYILGLLAQSWFSLLKPLESLCPILWKVLRFIQDMICTTRNGLFEGFLFVGLGMIFAFYDFSFSRKKALCGFSISIVLLLFEALWVKHLNSYLGLDMYLTLVPVAFFGFLFVIQIELSDKSIYRTLRMLSALIFYSHLWVRVIVAKVFKLLPDQISKSCLYFLVSLCITISGSYIVIRLSKIKKTKWLKIFYT